MTFRDRDYDRERGVRAAETAATSATDQTTFSVIDQYSHFDGTFTADRDLRIDGVVKGTISCKGTLFVAQGATVEATIEAENITIAGRLQGDVTCRERLQLLPSASVKGSIETGTLVIAEGAVFDGTLTMREVVSPAVASEARTPERTAREEPEERAPMSASPLPDESLPASESGAGASTAAAAPSTFIRRMGGAETPWESADDSVRSGERES